jgi:tetratricopeptide (TPR) repeat protein
MWGIRKFALSGARAIALFLATLTLASCASVTGQAVGGNAARPAHAPNSSAVPQTSRISPAVTTVMEAIRQDKLDDASRAVNGSLRLEPENPHLHFLNGFVYHLRSARGDPTQRDFAETGYLLALNFDPGYGLAAYQLGQLYLEGKRWRDAQDRFAQAIQIDGTRSESYLGLAVASYYARDLASAGWSVQKGVEQWPTDARLLRAAAIVAGASGDQKNAQHLLELYRAAEPNPGQYAAVERRLRQWQDAYEHLSQADMQPDSPASPIGIVPGKGAEPQNTQDNHSGILSEKPDAANAPGSNSISSGNVAANLLPNWMDCPGQNNVVQWGQSLSGGGMSGDETAALPALPSPCIGKPLPKMAIFDATILRTDDDNTSANGINILDGLSIVLQGSSSLAHEITEAGSSYTRTFFNNIGLPLTGITYSLNMFNASDQRVEVIARPSLVALDRQPSQFFSGSNITIAMPGQYGGST